VAFLATSHFLAALFCLGFWALLRRIGPQDEGPTGGGLGQDAPGADPFSLPPGHGPHVFPLFGPPVLGGVLPPTFYPPNPFAQPKPAQPNDDKWHPQWPGDDDLSAPVQHPWFMQPVGPPGPVQGKAGIKGINWTSAFAPNTMAPGRDEVLNPVAMPEPPAAGETSAAENLFSEQEIINSAFSRYCEAQLELAQAVAFRQSVQEHFTRNFGDMSPEDQATVQAALTAAGTRIASAQTKMDASLSKRTQAELTMLDARYAFEARDYPSTQALLVVVDGLGNDAYDLAQDAKDLAEENSGLESADALLATYD
jgi:hypothetical protein